MNNDVRVKNHVGGDGVDHIHMQPLCCLLEADEETELLRPITALRSLLRFGWITVVFTSGMYFLWIIISWVDLGQTTVIHVS